MQRMVGLIKFYRVRPETRLAENVQTMTSNITRRSFLSFLASVSPGSPLTPVAYSRFMVHLDLLAIRCNRVFNTTRRLILSGRSTAVTSRIALPVHRFPRPSLCARENSVAALDVDIRRSPVLYCGGTRWTVESSNGGGRLRDVGVTLSCEDEPVVGANVVIGCCILGSNVVCVVVCPGIRLGPAVAFPSPCVCTLPPSPKPFGSGLANSPLWLEAGLAPPRDVGVRVASAASLTFLNDSAVPILSPFSRAIITGVPTAGDIPRKTNFPSWSTSNLAPGLGTQGTTLPTSGSPLCAAGAGVRSLGPMEALLARGSGASDALRARRSGRPGVRDSARDRSRTRRRRMSYPGIEARARGLLRRSGCGGVIARGAGDLERPSGRIVDISAGCEC